MQKNEEEKFFFLKVQSRERTLESSTCFRTAAGNLNYEIFARGQSSKKWENLHIHNLKIRVHVYIGVYGVGTLYQHIYLLTNNVSYNSSCIDKCLLHIMCTLLYTQIRIMWLRIDESLEHFSK